MLTNYLVKACSLAGLIVCLLTSCQTTYSAMPAGGGFSSAYAAPEAARPALAVEEPATLVASVSALPIQVTTSRTSEALAGTLLRAATSATDLQMQAPDTIIQPKQPDARRKFGVTQGAHIAGGALLLAGGITTISGFNSDEPGYEPLAIVLLGIILAVVGGAMLLFKGKTAHRRQKKV